ncbi:MAG: response regulator transcription factor [Pseudomonadota bacterium]
MRILIVEDEPKVSAFIQNGLCEEGHAVDTAKDGQEGHLLASSNDYDVIVLDVMLPLINGLVLCKRLREEGNAAPIIMLTARDTIKDKVQGLEVGADDYLTKPFSFEELSARIRALARRGQSGKINLRPQIADLVLDLQARKVFRHNKEIVLSNKEFSLLEYLMKNSGTVVTRTMIAEHVWDMHFDTFTNVIDVYVNYLRNKVDHGFEPKLIHTVRGRGYVLKV